MTEAPYKYHFLCYNRYGVLRPNWPLKLILAFLCRHVVLLVAFGSMAFKGKGSIDLQYLLPLLDKAFIVADLPALTVLYAMGSRRPDAGAWCRWIWRYGQLFIFGSVGLFLLITAVRHVVTGAPVLAIEWAMIAVNAAVVYYVGRSAYVRDLFDQFPEAREADKAS